VLHGVLATSTDIGTFELMRNRSGQQQQRAGWSALVWIGVLVSSVLVRSVIAAHDSDLPIGFPLAALWLVASVSAAHWTARRWIRRHS